MANNKQHVVATTNEILDTKSGKTLDRIVNKGGGGGGNVQKDVIVEVEFAMFASSDGIETSLSFKSCNYSADDLNTLIHNKGDREKIDYWVRIINIQDSAIQTNECFIGACVTKVPIIGLHEGSGGIEVSFIGPEAYGSGSRHARSTFFKFNIPWSYHPQN